MRALLRKDARWLLGFGLGGVLIALALLGLQDAAVIWIFPTHQYEIVTLGFQWIASTTLALFAGFFEEVGRTREYLVHRPVSRTRIFWTRQLGCLLVLAAWILLPHTLHLVGALLWREDAHLVDAGRWWQFVAHSTFGVLCYSVVLFSTTVARRTRTALVLALLASFLVLFTFAIGFYGMQSSSRPAVLINAITLGGGALFLLAAWRNDREGRESDLPWSRARLLLCGSLLVGLAVLGTAYVAHEIQWAMLLRRPGLLGSYPAIGRLSDGTFALVRHTRRRYVLERLDESRRPVGELTLKQVSVEWQPALLLHPEITHTEPLATGGRYIRGVRYAGISCDSPTGERCYVGSDGFLHLIRTSSGARPDDASFWTKLGKSPDGRPFSARAQVVGRQWAGIAMIGDPQDGDVWAYDLDQGGNGFFRLALPNGDRFVDNASGARVSVPSAAFPAEHTTVRGERGFYAVNGREFRPVPPEQEQVLRRWADRRANPPKIIAHGPTVLDVTMTQPDGALAFHHRYEPQRRGERIFAGLLASASALRAPPLAAVSRALPRPRHSWIVSPAIFLDPLAGPTNTVLAINLLLAVALAALALRRLRRLGAPGGRRAFWMVAVLLGGAAGFACYRAIETDRAWRRGEVIEPALRRAPLIQSAA